MFNNAGVNEWCLFISAGTVVSAGSHTIQLLSKLKEIRFTFLIQDLRDLTALAQHLLFIVMFFSIISKISVA